MCRVCEREIVYEREREREKEKEKERKGERVWASEGACVCERKRAR